MAFVYPFMQRINVFLVMDDITFRDYTKACMCLCLFADSITTFPVIPKKGAYEFVHFHTSFDDEITPKQSAPSSNDTTNVVSPCESPVPPETNYATTPTETARHLDQLQSKEDNIKCQDITEATIPFDFA